MPGALLSWDTAHGAGKPMSEVGGMDLFASNIASVSNRGRKPVAGFISGIISAYASTTAGFCGPSCPWHRVAGENWQYRPEPCCPPQRLRLPDRTEPALYYGAVFLANAVEKTDKTKHFRTCISGPARLCRARHQLAGLPRPAPALMCCRSRVFWTHICLLYPFFGKDNTVHLWSGGRFVVTDHGQSLDGPSSFNPFDKYFANTCRVV
jgi:hypothetical protein